MSNIYNKENFGKLIEAIENFGPEWIDTQVILHKKIGILL